MLKHRNRPTGAAGAVVMAGAIAAMGITAASAAARTAVSGTEHFQIMSTSATSKTSSIIATGLFTAGGTDTHTTSSTDTVKFPNGTFVITHSKGTGTQTLDPKTCLFTGNLKGTYTLGSGTGAYAKLTGSGTYQLSFLGIAAQSGGKCSMTLPPTSFQQVIRASGPVTLP